MEDFAEHNEFRVLTSGLERLPSQGLKHSGNAGLRAPVVHDCSGTTALNSFKFLDIDFGEGVPYCTGVFHDRTHQCFIALSFNI